MRTALMIAASFLLAAACGGSTTSSAGASGGTGGGGATGGTAGSGASGGSAGSGGTSGSGASGGTSGSSGTAGSGGMAGSPDWYSCSDSGQCTLFATNCCGGYCSSDAPISGWVALNKTHENDYQTATCATGMPCPGCLAAMSPDYLALCRAGKCAAVDLRTDALSACSGDPDCRLRWGGGCCEMCNATSPNQLVAVSKNADFTHAVCGNSLPPCCAPAPYPKDALAVCNAGHCAVSFYVGP